MNQQTKPQDNVPQVKTFYAIDKLKSYAKIKREILADKSWGNSDDRANKLSEVESLEEAITVIEKSDSLNSRIAELEASNAKYREALEYIAGNFAESPRDTAEQALKQEVKGG